MGIQPDGGLRLSGFDTLTQLAEWGCGGKAVLMKPISFKRHRFPPKIIRHAIWLWSSPGFVDSYGLADSSRPLALLS